MPKPQRMLLDLLGPTWLPEYTVSLGKRLKGYPTHYKLDLAWPERRIAVEVDGYSHVALVRRRQDQKKDEKLAALGWLVLRFTNKEVLTSSESVAEKIRSRCTTCR